MKSRFVALLLVSATLVSLSGPLACARADDSGGEHESGDSHDGSGSGHTERDGSSDSRGSDHESAGNDGSGSGGGSHSSEPSEGSHGKGEGRPGILRQDDEDKKAPKSGRGRQAAHDSARVAVKSGAVVPYKDVLRQLERQGAGRVLHVQLTFGSVRSIYELKVEDKQGNISIVTVDAGTGTILSGGGN